MPQNVLSTTPIFAPYIDGETIEFDPLTDSEMGGIALRDASQGLRVQQWTVRVSGNDVLLGAPSVPETVQFSAPGITEVSLAFTQNMDPAIAFVLDGAAVLWWFDTLAQQQVFTALPAGARNPRITLDDKRREQSNTSDIIMGFLLGDGLYMQRQRDRFGVTYLLYNGLVGRTLEKIAMNRGMRLQWQLGRAA